MIRNYSLVAVLFISTLSAYGYECVPGEKWFENCQECTCLRNGTVYCKPAPCLDDQCVPGSTWFNRQRRCHCGIPGSRPHSVCVKMVFQSALINMPCEPTSYLYDTCNWCVCNSSTKQTKCFHFENCWKTTGGVCTPGTITMEECFKCRCTHTRFRICVHENLCEAPKKKRGVCEYNRQYVHLANFWCIFLKQQECYSDYGCPGKKKCCHVEDCFFRCIDPI